MNWTNNEMRLMNEAIINEIKEMQNDALLL